MRLRQDSLWFLSLPMALSLLISAGCGGDDDDGGGMTDGIDTSVTSASIGPSGGMITSADGGAVLVVPAGALTATETITVARVRPSDASAPLAAFDPSLIYEFGPDGLTFSSPATLTLELQVPQDAVPGEIVVSLPRLLSESASGVEPVAEVSVRAEPDQRSLSGEISHFSRFAIDELNASNSLITVRHPLRLDDGEVGVIGMIINGADDGGEWEISAPEMSVDLISSDFDPFATATQAFVTCGFSEWPTVEVTRVIQEDQDFYATSVRFRIQCPQPPPGISAPRLVNLAQEAGQSGPEACNLAQGPCGETLGIWVATEQGGLLLSPLDSNPVTFTFSGFSPVYDILNLVSPTGTQSALQFSGLTDSFYSATNEVICDWDLGAFLQDRMSDVSPRGSGSVGASSFPRLITLDVDESSGGPISKEVSIANAAITAVGNASADAFLYVNSSTDQLVHASVAGTTVTETDVMLLADDVRRMRWDPASGIGAISDFTANSLTLFSWAGDGTLPTVFTTAPVGDGPVGIDVDGNRVVCAGFNDDTYTEILIDPAGPSVLNSVTLPIPFSNPKGAGQPLQPGHAFFLRDASESIVFSLFGADAVAFLPTVP